MPGDLLLFATLLFILYFISRKLTSELSALIYRTVKTRRIVYFLFAALFLPGTIIHELAHYVTALMLFVPVGKFNLKVEVQGNSIKLGSVSVAKTDAIRSSIIGFAPFAVGMAIIIIVSTFFINRDNVDIWLLLLGAYIIFQIGNTMFLSKSDIRSTYKLILIFAIVSVSLYLFGQEYVLYQIVEKLNIVAKTINLYLLFPIIVNMFVILVIKLFKKIV